jgi:hypothetical protein
MNLTLEYAELARVISRNREGVLMNGKPNRTLNAYDDGQLTMLVYLMKDIAKGHTDEFKREFYTACGYPNATL